MIFGQLLPIIVIMTFIKLSISYESDYEKNNSTYTYGPLRKEDHIQMQETFSYLKNKISSLNAARDSQNKFLTSFKNHNDSIICKSCLWTFNHIHDVIYKYYGKIGLFELGDFICHNFIHMTKEACHGYVFDYGPIIFDSIIDHYLTGEYICTFMHMCKNNHFITLNADDYARELLKDKPDDYVIPKIESYNKIWKVVHVSDIHTDMNYSVGSRGECPDPFCCRINSKSIANENFKDENRAGKWGYVGKCDLPLRTLLNFIDQVSNVFKPDFLIWTGDNPSHAEWDKSTADEILQVTTIFTEKFKESGIPVYPSLGNHEKYPSDQFYPFGGSKEKTFLEFFGNLWKDWLGEEAYQEFLSYGYYSKKHLNTNLRIISYNCLYCDVFNFFLIKNPTDPSSQIEWLEKTLRKAELNKEEVYMIGHIPAGDTSLLSECAKRYIALIDRFSHIIRGQFAGHTHFDEVKIMRNYFDKEKVNSIVYIAPSLTT
jgi:sphingomyelin phosphodiesterase